MRLSEKTKTFYLKNLTAPEIQGNFIKAPCPFCQKGQAGSLVVNIGENSFFNGYFKCTKKCVHGGFPFHFGRLSGIDPQNIPGFDPDYEPFALDIRYPTTSMNHSIDEFISYMDQSNFEYFSQLGISENTLKQMKIGFNGRYLVYPYYQDNGSCYASRCVLPESTNDYFWKGDENFFSHQFRIFNIKEIERCHNGTLFITDGEINLLLLKELGFPGISVFKTSDLEALDKNRFDYINHIFMIVENAPEAYLHAKNFATKVGFKARIIKWPHHAKRGYNLKDLAMEKGKSFGKAVASLILSSKAFSPFISPQKDYRNFIDSVEKERGKDILGHQTGFLKMDKALNGLSGLNIMGGLPKSGKSSFSVQISSEIARKKTPVIYYDFENGRKKIYLKILCRLNKNSESELRMKDPNPELSERIEKSLSELNDLLQTFRVITDRTLTADKMKRHIDFIKHETQNDRTVVIIDSLHKLPFKDLSERRTGIDAWLRNMESIRDEMNVTFLVISELSRSPEGSYSKKPDIGSFKHSGDIEYSADNAMIFMPDWDILDPITTKERKVNLWMVASRENSPGKIATYSLEYPYWSFKENADK